MPPGSAIGLHVGYSALFHQVAVRKVLVPSGWRSLISSGGNAGAFCRRGMGAILLGDSLVPRVWHPGWVCSGWNSSQTPQYLQRMPESEFKLAFFFPLENSKVSILAHLLGYLSFSPGHVGFTTKWIILLWFHRFLL